MRISLIIKQNAVLLPLGTYDSPKLHLDKPVSASPSPTSRYSPDTTWYAEHAYADAMFTGIIQHLGKVAKIEPTQMGQRLVIDTSGWDHSPKSGESIAINGCCLTVAELNANSINFDVIQQTLKMTTLGQLKMGNQVNIEPAVTATTMMSGHLVQGHIDGVGIVQKVVSSESESRVRIQPPEDLLNYIIAKGSIAVDGISLTIADLEKTWFEIALIPTTLKLTTLGQIRVGNKVNLETDYIAKTVVHYLTRSQN